MDNSETKLRKSETFTAEEVRKLLGLNDDYSNSSSSSSSDCENDTSSDVSFHTNAYEDKCSDEETIPPSPKRVKIIKNGKGNDTGKNESGQWHNICTSTSTSTQHNPVDCFTQECDTSGSNHLHTSPHDPLPNPTQLQYSETQYPANSNHVEQRNEENTNVHNIIPNPILTIDLGILPQHGTNVQIIQIPLQTDVGNCQSFTQNNTTGLPQSHTSPSFEEQVAVQNEDTPGRNHHEYDSSSDNDDPNDYYEVQREVVPTQTPRQFTPIVNYPRDQILDCDVQDGWEKIEPDIIPDHCQFTGSESLNMSTESRLPEDFFNDIFDERMFTIMAEETNKYARQKIRQIMQGRDHFQQIDHYTHRKHARLGTWKDINASDIKIFIAHLLVMSSVHKKALHNYWSTQTLSRTPFFGQYIGRNKFQDILWNLHVCDTTNNPPPGSANHDPLAKVRPLLEMCQMNFRLRYTPGSTISLDESTMAFKGRVR